MDSLFAILLIAAFIYFALSRNPKNNQSSIVFDPSEAEKAKLVFNTDKFNDNIHAVKMIVIPVIFIGLLAYGFKSCVHPFDDVKITNREEAFYRSETLIKKFLKSPSTANFPIYDSHDVKVFKIDSITFQVESWVDAENSFGAMLRSNYIMRLKNIGNVWEMSFLMLDGKKIYP